LEGGHFAFDKNTEISAQVVFIGGCNQAQEVDVLDAKLKGENKAILAYDTTVDKNIETAIGNRFVQELMKPNTTVQQARQSVVNDLWRLGFEDAATFAAQHLKIIGSSSAVLKP